MLDLFHQDPEPDYDRVPDCVTCPDCGEYRTHWIAPQDDDRFLCMQCGALYEMR